MDNSNDNYLAPVIYIAESLEQAINYKWDSRANGLNKNICVLSPNDIQELSKNHKNLALPYDLIPGEVLVRHPYNQGYILAKDAEDEYFTATAEGIFLIARCLGASKIAYKKCNIAEFTRKIDNNSGLKYKEVDLNIETKQSLEQTLLNKISMTREFPVQDFTIEQFEKAQTVASERGLLMSRDIRSILEARDPRYGAPMTRQTVNIEISSSLNRVLDIAFSLNTVPFFKLDSNSKIATQKKIELSVEWDIIF